MVSSTSDAGAPEQAAPAASPPSLAALEVEAARLDAPPPGVDQVAPPPATEAAPSTIKTAELLEGLLAPFAALLPTMHHGFAAMPVKTAEIKMLAAGWAGVLDHYFPGGVGAWGPWGAALLSTAAVVGPRLLVPPPSPSKSETAAQA